MQSFSVETHLTNVMQVRLFDTSGKEIQSEADARARVVNRATLFVSSGESCIVKAAPATGHPRVLLHSFMCIVTLIQPRNLT